MIDNKSHLEKFKGQSFLGDVVDREDPESLGRIRVRINGLFNDIEDDKLPWCYPSNNDSTGSDTGGSNYSIPKKSAVVLVKFLSDDPYHPVYTSHIHLSDQTQELVNGDYDAQVLWYTKVEEDDRNLQLFYTKKEGVVINFDTTSFNITPSNDIIMKNNGESCTFKMGEGGKVTMTASNVEVVAEQEATITSPTINVEGSQTNIGAAPNFSAVMAEPLWGFLKALAATVDSKFPVTPGAMSGAANAAEQASTSKTVKTTI